ncbi:MAG TPA: exo-beta-N-acetylmuramidase NamZ domain-containing protein [Candidatus Solibacter sp.]|nr:exo-beta-N-acetylmuramidase NamZ domain-containing protein [Candidatus Solibacter sp.]
MKFLRIPAFILSCWLTVTCCLGAVPQKKPRKARKSPASPQAAKAAKADPRFAPVDALVRQMVIGEGVTGAVLLIGHNGKIVHEQAFGLRSLSPKADPMTTDTVFDLASLTKVVATTPSVMRLVEYGQMRLSDAVSKFIPEFGTNGKQSISIRELLTHYSGLRPDLDLNVPWEGEAEAFRRAHEEKLQNPAGAKFVYSDINFIVLGELVQRVSGLPLDKYADAHIFQPLGMKHTRFLPPFSWQPQIATTLSIDNHHLLRGTVQDPTAERMGGVAGHAGVFSTAEDLAIYAQALIDRNKILTPDLIEKMTTPQQPPNAVEVRGFGWDIDSPFSTNRGELLPVGSFGHTGFSGTSMWIDPYSKTYIILLTNSVRPRQVGVPVVSLRSRVANTVASVLDLKVTAEANDRIVTITGYNESRPAGRHMEARNGHVLTGIDVLEKENFESLKHGREQVTIGLLTNQTGLDSQGRRTIDVLAAAPGIKLAAIFSPEHGIFGAVDTTDIQQSADTITGVPVYGLYGDSDAKRRPPVDILRKLDAVLVDVQDVGARFYTYPATLGYLLEAAAQSNTEVVVLDRPNPITGSFVQGPVSQPEQKNFNNYHPVPVRHGMTLGELGQLYNVERKIGARLRVVAMQGWLRGDWFDSTGIVWTNPSPNLRSLNEAILYPGVALIERTNVSVGRGTDTPFEVVGAPWIDPRTLADALNQRLIAGVRFVPVTFTPNSGPYANQRCGGVNLIVTERNVLDSPEMGIELASALQKLYPNDWKIASMMPLLVNRAALNALSAGADPRAIAQEWRDELEKFVEMRGKYLLYK